MNTRSLKKASSRFTTTAVALMGLLVPTTALAYTYGEIVAWGANGSGQCTVPSPNQDFTAIE
jgi:hypothetical protein